MTRVVITLWALFLGGIVLVSMGMRTQAAPVPAPGTVTQTALTQIALAAIAQLPAFVTAIALVITAFVAVRNGKKTEKVSTEVKEIAVKQEETHAATIGIAFQSDKIAAQTDGHLTKLTQQVVEARTRQDELEQTIKTLVNILTATRVAEAAATGKETVTTPAVRAEDLTQAIETIATITPAQQEPRDPDQRRKP